MKQKNIIVTLVVIFFCHYLPAQKVYNFYLDGDLRITQNKRPVFRANGHRVDSVFKVDCFANRNKLYITACFTDSSLEVLHGCYQRFYDDGAVQLKGNYFNGKKNGIWESFTKKRLKSDSAIYQNNKRLIYHRFVYGTNNITAHQVIDDVKKTFLLTEYSETGTLTSELFYNIDTTGILKTYNGSTVTIDTLNIQLDSQAKFNGGKREWAKHLQRVLDGFNPADNGAPPGRYQTVIGFIVHADGSISNVMPETSFGFGMEEKAKLGVIKSASWLPATSKGKSVASIRRQPITFVIEEM